MKPMPRGVRTVLLACLWIAAAVATHLPPSEMPRESLINDKVVHFTVFGALGLIAAWRLAADREALALRHLATWWLVFAAYALLDEATQPWVGRSFEWLDWVADAAGAAFGLSLMLLCHSLGFLRTQGGDVDAKL